MMRLRLLLLRVVVRSIDGISLRCWLLIAITVVVDFDSRYSCCCYCYGVRCLLLERYVVAVEPSLFIAISICRCCCWNVVAYGIPTVVGTIVRWWHCCCCYHIVRYCYWFVITVTLRDLLMLLTHLLICLIWWFHSCRFWCSVFVAFVVVVTVRYDLTVVRCCYGAFVLRNCLVLLFVLTMCCLFTTHSCCAVIVDAVTLLRVVGESCYLFGALLITVQYSVDALLTALLLIRICCCLLLFYLVVTGDTLYVPFITTLFLPILVLRWLYISCCDIAWYIFHCYIVIPTFVVGDWRYHQEA